MSEEMVKIGILEKAIEQTSFVPETMKARHGAVIFKGSRLFGAGYNNRRHVGFIPAKYVDYRHSLHAEIAAIKDVDDWSVLNGSHILVVRVDYNGNLRNARPCNYCSDTLKHFRLNKVYYTTQDGRITWEKVRNL